jgi:hypothetical protein
VSGPGARQLQDLRWLGWFSRMVIAWVWCKRVMLGCKNLRVRAAVEWKDTIAE